MFKRYIGIDYSVAKVPTSSLKGLRVYMAENKSEPEEVPPPPGPRKYWNRQELAWLHDTDQSQKLSEYFEPELNP